MEAKNKLPVTYELTETCLNCGYHYACIEEFTTNACVHDGVAPPQWTEAMTSDTFLTLFQSWLNGRQVAPNGVCDLWEKAP
jgi:hypothetical protein